MGPIHRIDPASDGGDVMTINVGVDLHKTQFTVFIRRGEGTHGQYATTEAGFQEFFSAISPAIGSLNISP